MVLPEKTQRHQALGRPKMTGFFLPAGSRSRNTVLHGGNAREIEIFLPKEEPIWLETAPSQCNFHGRIEIYSNFGRRLA
ncbi:hypothetical protein BKI51_08045 [Alphaproteobacteria bacterium AO1-B]|nr:hypothetical protein BKI51_08045 [Alphaproteobacteria bacterium AO1-B]